MTLVAEIMQPAAHTSDSMRATVFHGPGDIRVEEVPRPHAGAGEAVIRVTMTTICGTDVHIVKGEYPVRPGLIIGHEPVGVIEELGAGVTGYEIGQRVLVGAITPCGQCRACLSGNLSQCGHGDGYEALGGWRFGNTIDGAQAEYLLVPAAQANLTPIPDGVSDEQVVLLADIASTGFAGAESGNVRIGDAVVVFALGPIGLCAVAGSQADGRVAHHRHRQRPRPPRDGQAHGRRRRPRLHPGRRRRRGPEAHGRRRGRHDRSARAPKGRSRTPCAACGRAARCRASACTRASSRCRTTRSPPAWAVSGSSPPSARAARSECEGSSRRSKSGRFDPLPLITHQFALDDIVEAYDLFSNRRDGVLKVAVRP